MARKRKKGGSSRYDDIVGTLDSGETGGARGIEGIIDETGRTRKKKSGNWIKNGMRIIAAGTIAGMIGTGTLGIMYGPAAWKAYRKTDTSFETLANRVSTITILDRNGKALSESQKGFRQGEKQTFLLPGQIPDLVKHAYISAEDKNFLTHGGIDFEGTAKGALRSLLTCRPDMDDPIRKWCHWQAGSGITQQTAKRSLFGAGERPGGLKGKAIEAGMTYNLERTLSKEEILAVYANNIGINYGEARGVFNAWKYHYNEDITDYTRELTEEERSALDEIARTDPRDLRKGAVSHDLSEKDIEAIYRNKLGTIDFSKAKDSQIETAKGKKNVSERLRDILEGNINLDAIDFVLRTCYEASIPKAPGNYDWIKNKHRKGIESNIKNRMGYVLREMNENGYLSESVKKAAKTRLADLNLDDFFTPGNLDHKPLSTDGYVIDEFLSGDTYRKARAAMGIDEGMTKDEKMERIRKFRPTFVTTLEKRNQDLMQHKVRSMASITSSYLQGFQVKPPNGRRMSRVSPVIGEVYDARVKKKIKGKDGYSLEISVGGETATIEQRAMQEIAKANAKRKWGQATNKDYDRLFSKIKEGDNIIVSLFEDDAGKSKPRFRLESYKPRVDPYVVAMDSGGNIVSMIGSSDNSYTNLTTSSMRSGSRMKPFERYCMLRDREVLQFDLDDETRSLIAPIYWASEWGSKGPGERYYFPNDMHDSPEVMTHRQSIVVSDNVASVYAAAHQFDKVPSEVVEEKFMKEYDVLRRGDENDEEYMHRLRGIGVAVWRQGGRYFLDNIDLQHIAYDRVKRRLLHNTEGDKDILLSGLTNKELRQIMMLDYGLDFDKYPVNKAKRNTSKANEADKLVRKLNVLSFNYLSFLEKMRDVTERVGNMKTALETADIAGLERIVDGTMFVREKAEGMPELVIYSEKGRIFDHNSVKKGKKITYLEGTIPGEEQQNKLGLRPLQSAELSSMLFQYGGILLSEENIYIDGRASVGFMRIMEEEFEAEKQKVAPYHNDNGLSAEILRDHPQLRMYTSLKKLIEGRIKKEHGIRINPRIKENSYLTPSVLLGEVNILSPLQEARLLAQIYGNHKVDPHMIKEIKDSTGKTVWSYEKSLDDIVTARRGRTTRRDLLRTPIHDDQELIRIFHQMLLGPTADGTASRVNGIRISHEGKRAGRDGRVIFTKGDTSKPYEVAAKTGTSNSQSEVGIYGVMLISPEEDAELAPDNGLFVVTGISNYYPKGSRTISGMRGVTSANSVPLLIDFANLALQVEYEGRGQVLEALHATDDNTIGMDTRDGAVESIYVIVGKAMGAVEGNGMVVPEGYCQNDPYQEMTRQAICITPNGTPKKILRVDKRNNIHQRYRRNR